MSGKNAVTPTGISSSEPRQPEYAVFHVGRLAAAEQPRVHHG